MAASLPEVPPVLKKIQPYIKLAIEYDRRDPVISYWLRVYAMQTGLDIDKKSKESLNFLIPTMNWLEQEKKVRHDNESVTNEVVAQAYIETAALKLFLWADAEDRAARFSKNVVKIFFTSGLLYDILKIFGEYTDEVAHHMKYAKWKATYIHNCLKNGETPQPGPMGDADEDAAEFQQPTGGQPLYPPESQPTGLFPNVPSNGLASNFNSLIAPAPGVHAPPSTPSGSSQPSPSSSGITYVPPEASNGAVLRPEDFQKAQKYCKWAGSALQYEDVPTAIDNLQKALSLLTTGQE